VNKNQGLELLTRKKTPEGRKGEGNEGRKIMYFGIEVTEFNRPECRGCPR